MISALMAMARWAKSLFGRFFDKTRYSGLKPTQDPFKRRNRSRKHKNRHFFYIGEDGNRHEVRQGKPFPVRPMGHPHMVIATPDNRVMLSVPA